ncbi:MAG: agmatine deiminase family protein [Gemmatimonadales bacterium]|nr:agmatine deiminase family protein [Gemmatimonadales bacterium]
MTTTGQNRPGYQETPAEAGFSMPPEWAPHRGTWLSWPHRESSWPGKLHLIPTVFGEIVRHLAGREEVHINVADAAMEAGARLTLAHAGVPTTQVFFHHHLTNDAWCRDHGPIFVQRERNGRNEQIILDWGFNAWGNKYPPFEDDDRIPTLIGEKFGIPVVHPGLILEGGSIDVNGAGTLLTTESCLLNPNRNPSLSKDEIEQALRQYLGVANVLWLGDGIEGDDTDGHIDDLTRFVDPTTVVTVVETDPSDRNYGPLQDNLERLSRMRDQDGRTLDIVTLPMPRALYEDGQRIPASYANFYVANGVVLMPGYDVERDEIARETLQSCFPDREVVVIDCTDLAWGLGAIHCVTQQWPA